MLTIRHGNLNDLSDLQRLFEGTVTTVCRADYDEAQTTVWASSVENTTRWESIVKEQYLLVAEDDGLIVGFCSLAEGHYVDMLYVHKNHQSKGIATQLYHAIEAHARTLAIPVLTSDVSKTAKAFFEKVGFALITPQTVVRKGVMIDNYKMAKRLV
jgi:putative acetyltransferase